MSLQSRLCIVFFDGTSSFGAFKGFTFKDFTHFKYLLNEVFFVLFSSGKFPERIKEILHVYLWHFFNQWKQLTHISEVDISFSCKKFLCLERNLFLVITSFTILATWIIFFLFFTSCTKAGLTNGSTSFLFHTHFTDSVSVFIFLPSVIATLAFVYFFLTNLTIVRVRAYDYGSIYDIITSVICSHITTDARYRINFTVAV